MLELSSQGLTQHEIASKLMISQKTISNFYQLRKEAWKQFHDTKNEDVRVGLYKVISSLNQDLAKLFGIDDMAELEIINALNERLEGIEDSTFQEEE